MTILLGDEAQVEACLSSFGDSCSVDVRKVRGLCLMYHWLRSRVGRTRWNSKVSGSCGISFRSVWRQC
jgi:hypothetical protein